MSLTIEQMKKAMDEWLSVVGLTGPEINLIQQLKQEATKGERHFREMCLFFAEHMPPVVISAAAKAREQGKCKCWPA